MADLLNELFLKFLSLTIRFVQLILSLVIVGFISQFLTTLSDQDLALPQAHIAALAISCVAAVWSLAALLMTCCAGKIMLEIETTLDVVCALLSVAQAAILSKDATCTLKEFNEAYSGALAIGGVLERNLIKASFGTPIVNVIMFSSTSIMSWSVFIIRQRREHCERHPF